jgi:hypothetical protein
VAGGRVDPLDLAQLGHELVAEALDAPADPHEIAALEPPGGEVGVAEHPRRQGAAAVAQLERQVRRTGLRGQPVLARAGEDALDRSAGAEAGDGRAVGCDGGHPAILRAGSDGRKPV